MLLEISAQPIERVLITANTEYHMAGDLCVGVRDRRSGDWLGAHGVVGKKLLGCLGVENNGSWSVRFGEACEGFRLYFAEDTLTSPLKSIVHALPAIDEQPQRLAA